MFSPLASEQTGIATENRYDDPRMWGELEMEFSLGSVGTGVAIGDYDHDGRPDVYIISKIGRSRLFRNLGNWRFEDVTGTAGLGGAGSGWVQTVKGWFGSGEDTAAEGKPWEQGAAFADVNNELLDLYVCRFVAPNQLFINQGDGVPRTGRRAGHALSDACGMGAFLTSSRWLARRLCTPACAMRREPDGSGITPQRQRRQFVDVTNRPDLRQASRTRRLVDFNQDGWPDIYVSNDRPRTRIGATVTELHQCDNESVAHLLFLHGRRLRRERRAGRLFIARRHEGPAQHAARRRSVIDVGGRPRACATPCLNAGVQWLQRQRLRRHRRLDVSRISRQRGY
jgi:hypothetical protein